MILSLGVADLRVVRDAVVSAGRLGVGRNHEGVVTLVHDVLDGTGDDNLALDGAVDRHVGLDALAVRAKHLDTTSVIRVLTTDDNIRGVHSVRNGELRRIAVAMRRDVRVVEHVGGQHVLLSQARSGFTVGEHLNGVLRLHRPRLRSLTVSGVHRFIHVALLGDLHVEPEALTLTGGGPGGPAEISRGELRRLRITVVGDRRSLRDRLVALGAFVGQNNLSVNVFICALATTRCVDRVVDRHSAACLGHRRRMVGGHRQVIRRRWRRSGDAHRLFAIHSDTHRGDIWLAIGVAVIRQTRRLADTGLSEVVDETCDLSRTVVHARITIRAPFFGLVVEELGRASSSATVITVVGGIHDANHTGRDILVTSSLTTGNSLVHGLVTRELELVLHISTGDTGLAHEPVNTVLTPALRDQSLTTLGIRHSVIEERVANVEIACGTQVATGGTTGTTVISECWVCTHKGSASKRHQRGSSNSLLAHLLGAGALSRTRSHRSHRTSLSVVVELKTDLLLCNA